MKRFFLLNASYKMLSLIVLAFIIVAVNVGKAQDKPYTPKLSLTGASNGYDPNWYPDGRIEQPPSLDDNHLLEFLMPVFIDNRWYTYYQNSQWYKADPITSFSFDIKYDSTALEPIGIETSHPTQNVNDIRYQSNGSYYEPLASNFQLSFSIQQDTSDYKLYLYPKSDLEFVRRGSKITITGVSTTDFLPLTDTTSTTPVFQILLYVRFRILVTQQNMVLANGKTPIYIDPNDTIRYNNMVITKDNPFQNLAKLGLDITQTAPSFSTYNDGITRPTTGVEGMHNDLTNNWQTEPTLPGSIYIEIEDAWPSFGFNMERGIGSPQQLNPVNDGNGNIYWDVVDPITVDSAGQSPRIGTRDVQVLNGTTLTRLTDITIESDQPWLQFIRDATRNGKSNGINQNPANLREMKINWIDNILGPSHFDEMNNATTEDLPVYLQIRCDPSFLNTSDPTNEKCGVYTGFITFYSPEAINNPVRLRVTFIYFRPPLEPYKNPVNGRKFGIDLTLNDSKSPNGDQCDIVFGTGYHATDHVDSLFGEYAYTLPMTPFTARFFPLVDTIPGLHLGFGDWDPNDETPQTVSRDIRSSADTIQSIVYKVEFMTGDVSYYPVTISWDIRDFPDNARLFLRDTTNGSNYFNVDMRQATPLGNSRYSYTITDARWTSFLIEYSLPHIIQYVDANNNPIIKNGWNLLSMAVNPVNNNWKSFFPNAMGEPISYFGLYQQNQNTVPGVGYFIKYPSTAVDVSFPGSYIMQINQDNFPVLLYGADSSSSTTGWNTIGGLSYPIAIWDANNQNHFTFDDFNKQDPVDVNQTLMMGIYGYVPKQGYKEVEKIDPGLGYWVWVNKACYLDMFDPNPVFTWWYYQPGKVSSTPNTDKSVILNSSTKLTVRDNAQNEGELYISENSNLNLKFFGLPPTPPSDVFDIRFNTNNYIDNSNAPIIKLQGVELPASFTIDNAGANYTLINPLTNEVYGKINKGSNGSVIVKSNMVQVLKNDVSFALSVQPNPVISGLASVLNYNVPVDGIVSIKIYDMLGNEVQTLLNSERNAGNYSDLTINANDFQTGVYMVKITCGSYSASQTINVVK